MIKFHNLRRSRPPLMEIICWLCSDKHRLCRCFYSAAYTTLKYTTIAAIHIFVMKANISARRVIQLAVTERVWVFITVPQLIVTDGQIFILRLKVENPVTTAFVRNQVYIYRATRAPACRNTMLQKHFLMVKYKAFLLLVHLSGTKFL